MLLFLHMSLYIDAALQKYSLENVYKESIQYIFV